MIDCNTCKHITLTETQQNICGTKEHHRCDEYKHILYHWGKHPKITPCEQCKCDDFKYYIKNENASAYLDDLYERFYAQSGIPEKMFRVNLNNRK